MVPRTAQYVFDPRYSRKPSFLQEYKNATFIDEMLLPKSIEDVIRNPKETFVTTEELDLIIPSDISDIPSLVKCVQAADCAGPSKWIHPAIIVKGKSPIPAAPGFVMKDYASISRPCAEFYSIVADEKRKRRLLKRLETICQQLQASANAQLAQDSVLWFPSQINPELDAYITENQQE